MRSAISNIAAAVIYAFGLFTLSLGSALPAASQEPLTIFAAASLKNALDSANGEWEQRGNDAAVISYAASSALAKQIEAGAPADIFISADLQWMDYLVEKELIQDGTKLPLLGNRLVLISAADKQIDLVLNQDTDFAALLGNERLAVGQVDSVPAGKYAKAALQNLGQWDAVSDKLAQSENVRAALLLVSRGEAPFGVVYATDAAADKNVNVVAKFPNGSHPAIIYPIGLVKGNTNAKASAFYSFLTSPAAAHHFEEQGFTVLSKTNQ